MLTGFLMQTGTGAWPARWRDRVQRTGEGLRALGWIAERDAALAAIGEGAHTAVGESYVVLADGVLVGQAALRERLAASGRRVADAGSAALITAALEAFGEQVLAQIDGECSFVVWERRTGRLLAGADLTGRRPIYWARAADGIVCGDRAAPVAEVAGARALDVQVLAERSALIVGSARRTAWREVHRVGGGDLLRWSPGAAEPVTVALKRYAPFVGTRAAGLDDAAILAELLELATIERCAPMGLTSVWMSGGYDSTAVFASGRAGGLHAGQRLEPVSISYPVGSDGREDELIQAAADHWQAPVHWLTLGGAEALAAAFERVVDGMDDAFVHLYGYGMQALAVRSREVGASVGLCGYGGDAVFYGSPEAITRDLLRRGRAWSAWREFRAFGMGTVKDFVRRTVLPVLPATMGDALARRAGWPLPEPILAQPIPIWVHGSAVDPTALRAAASGLVPAHDGEPLDAYVIRGMLEAPFFEKVQESLRWLALEAGVVHRSPLMDRRVVDHMASLAVSARAAGGETKILLRRAMADRLPASVTGPRARRTGVPASALEGAALRYLSRAAAGSGPVALADLGAIALDRFEAALASFLAQPTDRGRLGLALIGTLAADAWVRRHSG
jgi:asparagine synthase (glutamine-hydrolysing)